MRKAAVVLLSGGLDSATALAWALRGGWRCTALLASYGQRHVRELASARAVAGALGTPFREVALALPWLSSSSLVNASLPLPDSPPGRIGRGGIPSTYVPGRNTILLALAASLADAVGATAIVIGANALDFSGYPDCRPEYYRAFARAINRGTRVGVEGKGLRLLAPLLRLTKAEIVRLGIRLGAPLELTWSCYAGESKPCGRCDSCKLRAKGFAEAGLPDPALSRPRAPLSP